MALGFIKKVFSFGKDKAEDDKAEPNGLKEQSSEAAFEQALAEAQQHSPVDDPVLEVEVETAGGPAPDEVMQSDEVEPQTEPDDAPLLPAALEASDIGVVPLSLLEVEAEAEAAEDETSLAVANEPVVEDEPITTADKTEAVVEAEEQIISSAIAEAAATVLPKGFSTASELVVPVEEIPQQKLTWFQRLRAGLARTSSQLTSQISALFTKRKLDEDTLDELEDLLSKFF